MNKDCCLGCMKHPTTKSLLYLEQKRQTWYLMCNVSRDTWLNVPDV